MLIDSGLKVERHVLSGGNFVPNPEWEGVELPSDCSDEELGKAILEAAAASGTTQRKR